MKLWNLSRNVRGLHYSNKRKPIESMVRKLKPYLVCFQETKMREKFDGFGDVWGLIGTWVGCL